MERRARPVVLAAIPGFMVLAGCLSTTEQHYVDFPNVDVDPPSVEQLEVWSKNDPWRRDPLRVAHEELQLRLDVPWKGLAYRPELYEYHQSDPAHPEWGTYVVRGYKDRAGRMFRYRVKLDRTGDIWYARQISHYVVAELLNPALEDEGH